jgi:Fic family protein
MREEVIAVYPRPPQPGMDRARTISFIQEIYKQDAYHSLSIEGYQVTEQLIQQIASGDWQPTEADKGQRDALAAKGYGIAFQSVLDSLSKTFGDEKPGRVFSRDLQTWYRGLFSPSVQAGILGAADLAGYRNAPVYIDGARHVPPGPSSVLDCMETFIGLLEEESEPSVRAVLGHFIFVFIHPYMDGNGRIGRFLMNLMLVSGGYPWTIIRTARRPDYMRTLEEASTGRDIKPFTRFVASEMSYWQHYAKEQEER